MKTAAVIAEYNPFHNGHSRHLKEARALTGADFVMAVMSGDFVQRGAPAVFHKYMRTRMALLSAAYSGRTAFAANCEINVNTGRDMANRTVYGVSEGNGIPDLFIPELLRYYREGRYPVDRLIRTYPFEEINKAFTDSLSGKVIKAVLLMPG